MENNPYKVLGISENSTLEEIKAAHRTLAKKYHPDTGGDENKILAINAAWEILKNNKNRKEYEKEFQSDKASLNDFKECQNQGLKIDKSITLWIQEVYNPINKLMAEVINPFTDRLKELSADPYDETLMASFCEYIEKSQKKIKRIHTIYQSMKTPNPIKFFSLSLYQCFSEMEDGINEWEIYTAGYVESYLHDGNEMLRKAKKQHLILQKDSKHLSVS